MRTNWTNIKIKLRQAWDSRPDTERKILSWTKHGISEGRLVNKYRPKSDEDRAELMETLKRMISEGSIEAKIKSHARSKIHFVTYQNTYTEKVELERRKVYDVFLLSEGQSVSFDVSQPCIYLLLDISDAVNALTGGGRGGVMQVTLSSDSKNITVFCESKNNSGIY